MKTISQTHTIKAPIERVFQSLTSAKDIKAWSGSPASFEAKEGGLYQMWDDWVRGSIKEIVPNKKLVQSWEPSDWKKQDKESIVTFTLSEKGGQTVVKLDQTNVPEDQYKGTSDGWNQYYLGAMKEYLENQ
jgi:uncharacterized protein YndB with AHSA1/START domain